LIRLTEDGQQTAGQEPTYMINKYQEVWI